MWWHREYDRWDDLVESLLSAAGLSSSWRRNITFHSNLWGGLHDEAKVAWEHF